MEPTPLPLRDIHLPPEISWWPPAIGWWILAVTIPLLIVFAYWLYRRITRKTAIKSAKLLLLAIKLDKQRGNHQKVQDISQLIRRVAISTTKRTECAGLTGEHWLTFLDRTMKDAPFSQGIGKLLADTPYRPTQPTAEEIAQLVNLCESWLNSLGKRRR